MGQVLKRLHRKVVKYIQHQVHTLIPLINYYTNFREYSKYLSILYGQASNDSMAPMGVITMATALPPLGWTRFSQLDEYIHMKLIIWYNRGRFISYSQYECNYR
jgi:hypothetical protein